LSQIRREIAELHVSVVGSGRMSGELEAVADGAELATQVILDAAENIEDAARNLAASVKRKQEQALALDIQDHVLRIFEACNFQDLGGQRIAKVRSTLKAVEQRLVRAMEDMGKADGNASEPGVAASHDTATLRGPKLEHDSGHASQDDVDKLLAAG
jgi:chemotaxis protein CheZ